MIVEADDAILPAAVLRARMNIRGRKKTSPYLPRGTCCR
jgi:hypothetical protein